MAQKKGQKPSVPQPPCDKLPESSKLSGSCKKDAKINKKKVKSLQSLNLQLSTLFMPSH